MTSLRHSGQIRACGLLWRASRPLSLAAVVFVLAEGAVPVAAMIALGLAGASIPAAVRDGLHSAAAHHLWVTLTVGCCLYGLSLLRGPAEDLLAAAARGRVNAMLQRRLVAAVGAPAGIGHLENPEVLDRLDRVRGELSGYQPADAPMTLAGKVGDRLAGLLACLVLCSFRWWLGLGLLAMWLLVRHPLRRMVAARVDTFRRSTEPLRGSWYYAALSAQPRSAAEIRIYGLSDWLIARYRELFVEGMAPTWVRIRQLNIRVAFMALLVLAGYGGACAVLGWDADRHVIGLSTLTVMLPMLGLSVPVGAFSAADFSLGLMLAGLPDLDELERSLTAPEPGPTSPNTQPQTAPTAVPDVAVPTGVVPTGAVALPSAAGPTEFTGLTRTPDAPSFSGLPQREALGAALDGLARRAGLDPGTGSRAGHGHGGTSPLAALTDREREVLSLIARGKSNREIGAELFITAKTASVHVSNILGKLGAASRTEAAAIAYREGS